MESTRQKKVSRLIQKELSIIFQQNARSFSNLTIITVTVVHVSPDLGLAKIYLSLFPSDNKDELLEKIIEKTSFLRNELSKKIRHQVRSIPELAFYLDDSLDYADNIDQLLKNS